MLEFLQNSYHSWSKYTGRTTLQTMDSNCALNAALRAAMGGGLGGWFGAIYGANVAMVEPARPRDPFHLALFVAKKSGRSALVGGACLGALTVAVKSYEYSTQDLK